MPSRCKHPDCEKQPSRGPSHLPSQFCAEHDPDRDNSVQKAKATCASCDSTANYGTREQRKQFCSLHKTNEMRRFDKWPQEPADEAQAVSKKARKRSKPPADAVVGR